jgi:hypothetical protein
VSFAVILLSKLLLFFSLALWERKKACQLAEKNSAPTRNKTASVFWAVFVISYHICCIGPYRVITHVYILLL